MGYAMAAGLPAIYGLYASVVPLVVYAFFGPSRVLVLGPDSTLSALIAATVLPLAAGDGQRAIALAGMLSILAGAMSILAGSLKLGFVTELLSKPVRYGYINGIAVTIIVGQLPMLLGFSVGNGRAVDRAIGLFNGIMAGKASLANAAIGFLCLAVILTLRRWARRIPGVLLVVLVATAATSLFSLDERWGVAILGPMPSGLPRFVLPQIGAEDLQPLLWGALAVTVISFADTSVLSRTFAIRGGYEVDANQELVAMGLANVACGLFQGFPVSSSSSRTPVAESAGAQTQMAGLVGAICIGLLLVWSPNLLSHLPKTVLAAVVISSCLGLIEISELIRLFRLRPSELASTAACFVGILTLGVIEGIFLAVGLALAAFVWRAWRPYSAVLGRVDGLKGYHDISRHPEGKRIPGLVLFRWDAPLFFANAAIFEQHVMRAIASAPTPTKWVVVAAEPVTDIDITAADMLADLDRRLHEAGMDLCFAEMKGPVKDRLKRYGLFTTFGEANFFPTLGQAVDAFVTRHQVEWKDWEEML